jgi:phospholipase C
MAEVFAHAVEETRSPPQEAFMDLEFEPGAGGGHVAVGVTGGPLETAPGQPGDDVPPITRQDAAVKVEVFPPKSSRPRITNGWSRFRQTGELAVVVGFIVPLGEEGTWTCRIHNVGPSQITCHGKVLFTALHRQILSTPIRIRTLNNALHQLLDAIGLRVHLDGPNSFVGPSRELQSLVGGAVSDMKIDVTDKLHDVNLETLQVEALRSGLGVDTPRVRVNVDFETLGPAEVQALGIDVLDVTAASLQVEFSLTTEGTIGRRQIVPSNFTVKTNLHVEVTAAVKARMIALGALLAGSMAALGALIGADEVEDEINDLLEALPDDIEAFLQRSPYRKVVGRYLTEGFQQLANRDHLFHDLKHTGDNWVVEHWDPAAPPAPPAPPPPPPPPPSPPPGGGGGGQQPPGQPPGPPPHIPNDEDRPPGTQVPFVPTSAGDPVPIRPKPGGSNPEALANLRNIDTIVVLMQENRSFDHMLGYLSVGKPRSKVEGLTGREFNTTEGNIRVQARPLAFPDFGFSPAHDFGEVKDQIADGAMSGFLTSYRKRWDQAPLEGPNQKTPLSYYTDQHLDVTAFLERHYLICNRWFCSFPGGTQPNRFSTLSGQTPITDNFPVPHPEIGYVQLPTLFEQLSSAGVDWVYYEHDVGFLRFYDRYRVDGRRVVPIDRPGDTEGDGFYARARNGTLPPVTFIDPNFVDIPPLRTANDDHAPAHVRLGQELIASVHDALVRQPMDRFARTLFVLTYDEHGGFYDHVAPPGTRAFQPPKTTTDNAPTSIGPGRMPPRVVPRVHPDASSYGARVPTIVISPRVAANDVTNIEFDHTSIAKTILLRFLGSEFQPLGQRMAQAHHLGEALTAQARSDRPLFRRPEPPPPPDDEDDVPEGGHIPVVPQPAPDQPRPAAGRPLVPAAGSPGDDGDEFHEAIRQFGRPIM